LPNFNPNNEDRKLKNVYKIKEWIKEILHHFPLDWKILASFNCSTGHLDGMNLPGHKANLLIAFWQQLLTQGNVL